MCLGVPGKVLATGDIEHSVTVAAFNFSSQAKSKILAKGGKYVAVVNLVDIAATPAVIDTRAEQPDPRAHAEVVADRVLDEQPLGRFQSHDHQTNSQDASALRRAS